MLEYLEDQIESEPVNGWHCPNVLNWAQVSQFQESFVLLIKELEAKGEITRLAYYLTELTRKIQRYERESEYTDERFRRWVSEELTALVYGVTNFQQLNCGVQIYYCPHCRAALGRDFDERIRKLNTDFSIRRRKTVEKYPKIELKEGENNGT